MAIKNANIFNNVRFILKNDELATWQNSTGVLEKGEIALARVTVNKVDPISGNTVAVPTYLMKVGDGVNKFANLNWLTAPASDVYGWAKKANFPIKKIGTGNTVVDAVWVPADQATGETEPYNQGYLKVTMGDRLETVTEGLKINIDTTNPLQPIIKHETTTRKDSANAGVTAEFGKAFTIVDEITSDETGHITAVKTKEITLPTLEKVEIPDIVPTDDDIVILTADGHAIDAKHKEYNPSEFSSAEIKLDKDNKSAVIGLKTPVYDKYGHLTQVTTNNLLVDLDGFKTKQLAYNTPNADGNATAFIDTITQDENGEIVVTKKNITAADLGLSNAMHFIGSFTEAPTKRSDGSALVAGDVYLNTANHKEYVYDLNGSWIELGDEGSHALKTITITANEGLEGGGTLEANRTIGIKDGGVLEGKLEQNVKDALALARTALQEKDISDRKVTQEPVVNKITDAAHVLTSLTQNANGDIAYEVKKLTPADIGAAPADNYKVKQTAVVDPTANGEDTEFIDSISQNENGVITVTKKKVNYSTDNLTMGDKTIVFNCGGAFDAE